MKRLLPLFFLALMLATLTRGVGAQDATPAQGGAPSTALLEALGYSTLDISCDGSAVAAPDALPAGRYLVNITDSSGSPAVQVSLFGANADYSADDIVSGVVSADLSAGPPPFYYDIKQAGGVPNSVVTLPAGDWVVAVLDFGADTPAVVMRKLTVTGDLPPFDAIPGSVPVTLVDLAIEIPETVPAGPHIFQVTNTGAILHFLAIFQASGLITQDEAVNGIMLAEGGMGTPVTEGSAEDPATWQELGSSGMISTGMVNLIEFDLEPGTYVAVCFVSGPGEQGSHAFHGMTQVFTVE